MKSSSYISVDPVFSVRTVDPYRTSSQPWTNGLYNTETTANPYDYDNIFIANSHHHHGYSNNTFYTRQQYQEMLDCPQCSLNDYKTNIPSINRVDIYGDYERMKENLQQRNQLDQRDGSKASEPLILGERRPLQDLTNHPTGYAPSFHNDFNYRTNAKEVDMAHYSRSVVINTQPKQVTNVSYSNEAYQTPLQRENCSANPHPGVNNIVGRKKGKSLNLIKRNRPGLDIDTSYNSNAHVLIIPADDGMDLKNLLHDSYTTRAGFMEMKRG